MKLRVRSLETKETLKIEIPDPCSLHHLKEIISARINSVSPSSSVHLSLNRNDELVGSSPEESIQSVGVTSGDLLFFTLNPNGFSSQPPILQMGSTSLVPSSQQSSENQTLSSSNFKRQDETPNLDTGKGKVEDSDPPKTEETLEYIEIDEDVDDSVVHEIGKSFSVPGFLRKVFTEQLVDDSGRDHKLLAIAVHAVLLESGFVGFDPSSHATGNKFQVLGNWHCSTFYYTLPEIISHGSFIVCEISSVKVKFQNLGKFCRVYGSLVNGTGMHCVLLDEDRLVPFLNVVWANCGSVVETMGENGFYSILPEREVFEFWRKVKDSLALPLLIDLCEKAGLELPPCFMRLPTELKLKILELLPGVDIAKVGSLCSELRYLASSEDLWKQKYAEEFGDKVGSNGGRSFKESFAKSWQSRKRRKITTRPSYLPRWGRRNPDGFPRFLGGDYDIWPMPGRFGRHGIRYLQPRDTMPRCNLGGSNS